MSQAQFGRGLEFKRGDGGAPETFVKIAEVRDVDNLYPEVREFEDVTNQDTAQGADEFMATLLRSGSIRFELNYIAQHATHSHIAGLRADHKSGVLRNFRVKFPGPSNLRTAFSAFVAEVGVPVPVSGVMVGSVVLRVSGPITTETDA
jgi:hypothetical protein